MKRLALALLLACFATAAPGAVHSSFTARTTSTGTFRAAALFPPRNLTAPTIAGTQTLTASPGTWSPAATAYDFRWERRTTTGWQTIASGPTYATTAADVDREVRVVVIARNAAGPSAPAASAPRLVDPPPPHGLRATYWSGTEFSGASITRLDPQLDFAWGSAAPDPAISPDFSARWTGRLLPRHSETYTLTTRADDRVRLWIDGRLLVDDNRWWADDTAAVALEAGRSHEIRVELQDWTQDAALRLWWESPSQPKQIVPTTRLTPGRPEGEPL